MNKKARKTIHRLCKNIKDIDYIEGMFATSLDFENLVILNFIINVPLETHDLNNTMYRQKTDEITYEYHIFYHTKEDYSTLDYHNLTDSQIIFLELLTLSDIFIDKTGILHYIKNEVSEQWKSSTHQKK